MTMYRFSGHDTFHCREQWLLKGFQLVEKQGSISYFRSNNAIADLGVGKNMVRSILHWMKAFNIYDEEEDKPGKLSELLFTNLELDPFLENEGSIWLLQYFVCSTEYATIFRFIFRDYFLDKASMEFSESQIKQFLKRRLADANQRSVTDTTLASDFKVFIKTYVSPKRNTKTVEDDFSAPMLGLNLVVDTGKRNEYNEHIYRVNRGVQISLSEEIFAFCLLLHFDGQQTINLDDIRTSLGAFFCLSNEGLEQIIESLCESYKEFIYKDDAGVRQIQLKNISEDFRTSLLKKHYKLHG